MAPSAATARARSILVVHPAMPAHDQDSGSRRLRWIVELMARAGHRVTFLAHGGFEGARYADELRDLGVEVHRWNGRWWREHGVPVPGPGIDLGGLLRRGRFDVAWLSTYEMGELYASPIRSASPATRVVIDTVDVHHLRELRGAQLSGDEAALTGAERTRRREAAAYCAADALVAVSPDDGAALGALAPGVPISVVSNVHALPEPGPPFTGRRGLVFVGSFHHAPNVDAMLRFVAGPWRAVRATLPDAELTIVGTDPPDAVRALQSYDGIMVPGWVPETAPYLDAARVSVAPLRYGAGVKGKIGEALAHGLPVVTTPVGAEGMDLQDGHTVLVAEDDAQFADAVVRLHGDRALWERLSVAGREHLDQTLGVDAARAALERALDGVGRRSFVVTNPWGDRGALRPALERYLGAFTADDPVSLVLPLPPGGPAPDTAAAAALEVIDALGADPARIPDVAIAPADERIAIPSGSVRVGPAPWPERAVAVLAPDADAPAWHAAGEPAPPDGRPVASIVICAYGKRDYTERCLASLDRALGPKLGAEVELVLVDNASPDDTRELFAGWEHRATVVALPENRNFAGGNNAGAQAARGDVLIFLNNDTEVPAGVVEALVEEALRPQVGLVGVRLLFPDGRLQHGGYGWRQAGPGAVPFHLFHGEDGELPAARACFDTTSVTGACIAVTAELFDSVGRFDEGFVNGWEDTDLAQRIRATGARVRYRGDLAVVHHEGVTSGGAYGTNGNEERFRLRWGASLGGDDELFEAQLGAHLGPLEAGVPGPAAAEPAEVVLIGPALGLGPAGDEARGLLAGLHAAGATVAARTPAPTWLGPRLDAELRSRLEAAHARAVAPGAPAILMPDASLPADAVAPAVVRLAAATAPLPGVTAWVPTPALAAELVRRGWPRRRVFCIAPQGLGAAPGAGGDGLLVCLPDHEPAVAEAVLAALAACAADLGDVAVLPTARTPELARRVAAAAPGAALRSPVTDEQAFASLAGRADVVLACDPSDPFDRRALRAAATGAAVVVCPGGPAAALLGDLAAVADPGDPAALAAALARCDRSADARRRRAETVAARCGGDALRIALRALRATAQKPDAEHAAGLEAFERGDIPEAVRRLEGALACGFDAEVANDLAVVCHAAGRHDRAVALLEECVARHPEHAGAHENLVALADPQQRADAA